MRITTRRLMIAVAFLAIMLSAGITVHRRYYHLWKAGHYASIASSLRQDVRGLRGKGAIKRAFIDDHGLTFVSGPGAGGMSTQDLVSVCLENAAEYDRVSRSHRHAAFQLFWPGKPEPAPKPFSYDAAFMPTP